MKRMTSPVVDGSPARKQLVFVRVLSVPKVAILMEKMMVNIDEAWDFRAHYCLDKASFWVFG